MLNSGSHDDGCENNRNVAPFMVDVYRRFKETYYLYLQVRHGRIKRPANRSAARGANLHVAPRRH
jgi:hypothetical protein